MDELFKKIARGTGKCEKAIPTHKQIEIQIMLHCGRNYNYLELELSLHI